MPDIIEQQDLLKGLPDARLATLMHNPVGDIPPFLVAAEAQRRQAIRQQFAGAGANESVVDTLIKQMANVPQNVQAPMQTPPQLPPPMPEQMAQQGGIAAIPQQGMADGGMVRRFQDGGMIEPLWRVPSFSSALPEFGSWVGEKARGVYDWATTPYSEQGTAAGPTVSDLSSEFAIPDKPLPGRRPEFEITGQPSEYTDLTPNPKPKLPRNPESSNAGTSYENQYKAEEAALRGRLAALYKSGEPSNWEEAQKWFAMSAQLMNPDANLLQGIVNAGNVYAQAESEQARASREDERALQEALLKWDMANLESRRASEASAAEQARKEAFELKKLGIPSANSAVDAYQAIIQSKMKDLDSFDVTSDTTGAKREQIMREIRAYEQLISRVLGAGGFGPPAPTLEELEAYSTGQ